MIVFPHTNRGRSAQVVGRFLVQFSDIANIEQMFYNEIVNKIFDWK